MCGIFGIVGKIDNGTFKVCLDTIAHRGPDGYGIWEDEFVQLGHRRLSIIDLSSNGKQPMEVADRFVITFNGEIYNYKEIRSQLEKSGVKFFSDSDTEVLLHSYLTWGPECVNRFNGMWAFAIWDKVERTLFISRDRIGKKPLFYSRIQDKFAFSSEMKALYPLLPSLEINFDTVNMAKQNVMSYEATEKCLIQGITRFPAGCNGIFKNGQLKISKYYDVFNNLISVPSRYEEQVEQFKELFIDSCKLRMRSDVAIGTALSGGLDSSATISTMAYIAKNTVGDYNKDWQHAFVASFPGSNIDETSFAKAVVDHIHIPATYLTIDPLKSIDKLDYYTYLFEDLYLTSPIPMIQLYGEVRRHGTTVTLDGHGADELFGGYPFDIYSKIKDDYPNIFRIHKTLKTYLEGIKQPYSELDAIKHTLYNFKNEFINPNKGSDKIGSLGALNSQLFQSTFQTILPTLLRNYDRYSMINGVEIRMPFLDHRIISLAFSLPASAKVRNGFTKAIVRDAMKDFMPHSIAYRKDKIGFNSPFTEWLRGDLRPWIEDIINSKEFNESVLINPHDVKLQVNAVINSSNPDYSLGEKAWTAIMPFIWEKSLKYAKRSSSHSTIRL